MVFPQGIAINRTGAGDADPGDIYVADRGNHRISQFSANGAFIRAFGFNVVAPSSPGGNVTPVSAVQAVNVPPTVTAGTFTLSFNGQTTGGAGTGTLTEGSNVVTALVTAKGTGTLTANSPTVTGLATTVGKFIVGQPVAGAGIPAGATVVEVSGTTLTLSANATIGGAGVALSSSGPRPFAIGQAIVGAGIPAGTTIVSASAGSLTLSANVGAGGSGVEVPLRSGIAYNATAAQVQTALQGLSSIGAGNATVSGGPGGTAAYSVTFAGALGELPVSLLSADSSNLTGGAATVSSTTAGVSPLEVCKAGDVCQAGTPSTVAGAVNNPMAVAVDQSTGNVYVNGNPNRRVEVFSADGEFQGAFGVGVRLGDSAPFSLDFCTAATGCLVGQDTGAAGAVKNSASSKTMTVDAAGNLYLPNPGSQRLDVFSPKLNGSNEVTGASFVRGIGWDVIPTGQPGDLGAQLEVCTVSSTCQLGVAGSNSGQFIANTPNSVAVDSGGFIYAVGFKTAGNCEVGSPCRIQKFNPDGTFKENFGPALGSCQLNHSSGAALDREAIAVAVDPSNQHVFVLKKTALEGARICELDSAGNEISFFPVADLSVAGAGPGPGLAVGTNERVYAVNRAPALYILGPVPPPTVEILPAAGIGATTATLHGKVTIPSPGGFGFDARYHFEYSGDNGFHWTKYPAADVAIGNGGAGGESTTCPSPQALVCRVSQTVTGLEPNLNYLVRLVASTGSSATSSNAMFATLAAKPTITQTVALPVTGTGAKLNALVNPNNSPTTYHFEWGKTAAYGNQAPAFDLFAGAGGKPLAVNASISGLELSTTYHFRLVATNESGTQLGPDTTFTTNAHEGLSEEGLPDDRGYELVSPPDKGAQGSVRNQLDSWFQAAEDGSGVVYPLLGGLEDTDSGGDTAYFAKRAASGWQSTKVSPPSLVSAPTDGLGGNAAPGSIVNYSPDLSCSIVYTFNPLTDDTPVSDVELGIYNLYVRHSDGTYRLITDTVPSNPEIVPIEGLGDPILRFGGSSSDCSRVYFKTKYDYFPGASGLYEWDDGVLRDAARLPNGAIASGVVGSGGRIGFAAAGARHAVSSDGSRFFFSALSNEPPTSGKPAVFLREGDAPAVEVSDSQGPSHSLGARYEIATPDGSHVLFAASYGLTPVSSTGLAQDCSGASSGEVVAAVRACDLYDYDVDTGQLTNLSATSDPANTNGAAVQGVLAISDDGDSVYFAARGQLTPGEGNTYAQNVAGPGSGTGANVYLSRGGGELTYVTTVAASDLSSGLTARGDGSTTVATAAGEHLLFQSRANITGYDSGGAIEVYLYSAEADAITCVSCRPDGQPSVGNVGTGPLAPSFSGSTRLYQMSTDARRIFFTMPDVLAPGAVSGNANIYEWEQGRVHLLLTGPPDFTVFGGLATRLYGATPSGDDVFIRTPKQLTPHDTDLTADLYDVRVGGGFPPPPAPPVPCNPAADECQGTPASQPAVPAPVGFQGDGNPPESKRRLKPCRKKGQVRRHGRCVQRHQRAAKAKPKRHRAANTNRGGAK